MASASKPKPSRVKVCEHRERLRRKELPAFRLEKHRQSLAVASGSHAHEEQAFIDAISIFTDEADRDE
jgi:hypothetical protein